MTTIYLLRHACTEKNILNSCILTILGTAYNQTNARALMLNPTPELRELYKNSTSGAVLPTPFLRAHLCAMQGRLSNDHLNDISVLGKYLSSLKNPYFVTSPSMRAINTAFILANSMGLPSNKIVIDSYQEFLKEVFNPNSDSARFFCDSLESYIRTSKEILVDSPLVVVSHGNILRAVHDSLYSGHLHNYRNCGLTIAEYNPHLRITHPYRSVSEL